MLLFVREPRGVAVLPVMILIGAIIIEIAIVGGILAFYGSTSNLSIRSSQEALFTARSGIEDALIRLVRDKGCCSTPYDVDVNSGVATNTAKVSVSLLDSPLTGQRTIVSTSTVSRRVKTVQAVVSIDSVTGKVDVVSFNEVAN